MNRIILIGNGFDLAHGLKTSYPDFMNDYWKMVAGKIIEHMFDGFDDGFVKFERISGPASFFDACSATSFGIAPDFKNKNGYRYNDAFGQGIIPEFVKALAEVTSYSDLKQLIEEVNGLSDLQFKLSFSNSFFDHLSETLALKSWLDIENEYYTLLKDFLKENRRYDDLWLTVKDLNDEFCEVKNMLEKYLTNACERGVERNESVGEIMDSLFRLEDIAISKQDIFLDCVASEYFRDKFLCEEEEREFYLNNSGYYENPHVKNEQESDRNFLRDEIEGGRIKDELKSNKTLLLNFNYTDTAEKLYADINSGFKHGVIHIHGELNNPDNPIIFGYGDELDEDYRKIESANDNDMLENVKSVAYGNQDNYRRLLEFLQLGQYQVFVMGHSCGNSDRTLLNEIFENQNCISVKLFYHKRSDGSDDFSNVYKNISRNFNNKRALRDIVVNKTFCEPMPQNDDAQKQE